MTQSTTRTSHSNVERPNAGSRARPMLMALLGLLGAIVVLFCPDTASAQATCDVAGYGPCERTDVGHLGYRYLYLYQGQSVTVGVENNTGGTGFPWVYPPIPPDPEIYVARPGGTHFEIVAYDDDGHPDTSQPTAAEVTFTVPYSGIYYVYVTSRSSFAKGQGRFYAEANGIGLASNTVIYGSGAHALDFKAGDELLLTKSRQAPTIFNNSPQYADPRLLVLDSSHASQCVAGFGVTCGRMWYSDDDIGTLSRVVPSHNALSLGGLAYVGVKSTGYTMHSRL